MRLSSWLVFGTVGAVAATACTQDFGKFNAGPEGPGATSSVTTSTSGGGSGTTTSGGGMTTSTTSTGGSSTTTSTTTTGQGGAGGGTGSGGMMGTGGGGGFMCGDVPMAPGLTANCPAECTGGCALGICVVDCDGTDCSASTIDCPADYQCRVNCGMNDCVGTMVNCPATWGCTLFCDGGSACQNATLTCSTGTCEFDCNKGNTVCDGATLECGSGSCNHTCGNMITGPTVNDNNGACELNNNGC